MKNKMVKVIAVLTALVTLFSFAACGGKNEETTTTQKSNEAVQTDVVNNEAEGDVSGEAETEESEEPSEDDETTKKGDKTTKKDDKKTTKKDDKKTTKKEDKKTTKKEPTTKTKTYSDAEIVKICTDAINKAKKESPGYTKAKYQKLEGDRSVVPSFYNTLFGFFEEDSTKTYKKGESDETNYGVDGWVATKVSDPTDIKMEIKNGKYIINYKFGDETNPEDLASRYGRTMDIMTPAEVKKKSIGLISEVNMVYHDGFLTAEIDIETGRLTYMKMGSSVDAEVNKSKPDKAFTVKDIVSIATYTDFKW